MKVELTKEQIDKLVAVEEKRLRTKFEKDLAAIRKKYEVVEVDFKTPSRQTKKSKLTEEQFKQYLSDGLTIAEIAEKCEYNIGYLYKLRKQVLSQK
ncbi:MAG: hypothetical protein JNK09_15715 [Prolixibacteraceae bacterium]|nr:hypothetical protein [Prolixibacteraceae bacterium]